MVGYWDSPKLLMILPFALKRAIQSQPGSGIFRFAGQNLAEDSRSILVIARYPAALGEAGIRTEIAAQHARWSRSLLR